MTTARAPVRISFVTGGDADYYLKHLKWGNALNATISLGSEAVVGKKEEKDAIVAAVFQHFQPQLNGQELPFSVTDTFPRESGLGGSAAHCVAAIRALNNQLGLRQSKHVVALQAYRIERELLGIDGGYQDQFASAFGGFNYMVFRGQGQVEVSPLKMPKGTVEELEERCVLVHIPRSVSSAALNTNLRVHAADAKVLEAIALKRRYCTDARAALEQGDVEKFIAAVDLDYRMKKAKSPMAVTPQMETVYEAARKAGCLGGKFMGAGGGGCAIFFARNREKAEESLKKHATLIDFKFER